MPVGSAAAAPPKPPPAPASPPPAAASKPPAPSQAPSAGAAAPKKDGFETKKSSEIKPRDGGVSGKAEIKTEKSASGEKTYGKELEKGKAGATLADAKYSD